MSMRNNSFLDACLSFFRTSLVASLPIFTLAACADSDDYLFRTQEAQEPGLEQGLEGQPGEAARRSDELEPRELPEDVEDPAYFKEQVDEENE